MYQIKREGNFALIKGDTIDDIEGAVRYLLRNPVDHSFVFNCSIGELNVYIGPLDGYRKKEGEKESSG